MILSYSLESDYTIGLVNFLSVDEVNKYKAELCSHSLECKQVLSLGSRFKVRKNHKFISSMKAITKRYFIVLEVKAFE